MAFEREHRYLTIKLSDLKKCHPMKQYDFFQALDNLRLPDRKFVVVESDWPEYEPVWNMIETRVNYENERKIENNIYANHDLAERVIRKRLNAEAHNDCEGSYCFGDDVYTQQYLIEGSPVVYIASLEVEYNRHDKTNYYVDGTSYSYKELT